MAQNSRSSRFETGNPNTINPDQSANLALVQLSSRNGSAHGLPADRRHAINRRGGVWQAFLYGNFRPRRRLSRRAVDEYQILFDWHEPRILYLALAIMLLSCIDALFTLNLLNEGATEGNTFMASMLNQSVEMFLAVKFSITSISLVFLVAATRRKFYRSISVEHLLQVFCAGYVLLISYEIYLAGYVFELRFVSGP